MNMRLTVNGLKTFLEVAPKRTVILNSDDADILIDLLLDSDNYFEDEEWEIIQELENYDVIAVTRDEDDTYWVETALGKNGKVKSFETYLLVECEALEDWQIFSIKDDFELFSVLSDRVEYDEEEFRCDCYDEGFKDGYHQAIGEAIDILYDKLK